LKAGETAGRPLGAPKFSPNQNMKNKIKIHDGIVGAVIFTSVILGLTVASQWLYVAGFIGALMFSSAFTGFCPVYFVLNKLMPTDDHERPSL
jgi:hypothetical protein